MPIPRHTIFAATFFTLVAGGGAFYETSVANDQREQLSNLRERQEKLTAELHQVLRQDAERAGALATAQAELAALGPAIRSPAPAEDPIAIETQAWLDRLQTLKRMFAEHPELRIPELAQLTEPEWFFNVKNARLETDEQVRQSLAAVRTAAKLKFAQQMASALQKYLAANQGQLPPSPQALYVHFIRTIDPSFFERYESLYTGNIHDVPKSGGNEIIIREKAPVDEDYDSRVGVNIDAMRSSSGSGPQAWVDAPDGYDGMIRRARAEFARANNGAKAEGLEQLAPYLNPPLPSAKLEKLLKLEREQKK